MHRTGETRNVRDIARAVLLFVLAVGGAALVYAPLCETTYAANGAYVSAWRAAWLVAAYPFALGLSVAAAVFVSFGKPRVPASRLAKWVGRLSPLAWFTPLALASYAVAWTGVVLAGLFVPIGFTFAAALALERCLPEEKAEEGGGYRIFTWSVAAYFVFLLVFGFGVIERVGGHGGDEKHYVLQQKSLMEDGDLDLTRELHVFMEERGIPPENIDGFASHSHIKRNREGRYYSYHSCGLPLLSWPFGYLGTNAGNLLFLCLVAALSAAGCRAAVLASGAGRKTGATVSWLFVLTCGWLYNAVQFLPEILGCGLAAWALWATFATTDPKRRAAATVVAAACAGYLPWAHIRFAPLSLALAACFGIETLFFAREERLAARIGRLVLFGAIYAVFGFTLLYVHSRMFSSGGAYDYEKVFFAYPAAMWLIIAYRRGLGAVIPMLLAVLPAIPVCLFLKGRSSRAGAYAAFAFAIVLVTCCSTTAALGGACTPGRYLLQTLPVSLPAAALVLTGASRPARVWFLFLSLLGVFFFLAVGFRPFACNGGLIRLPENLLRYPGFATFWQPFADAPGVDSSATLRYGSLFTGAVLATSTLLFAARRPAVRTALHGAAAATALLALFWGTQTDKARRDACFSQDMRFSADNYGFIKVSIPRNADSIPGLFGLFVPEEKTCSFMMADCTRDDALKAQEEAQAAAEGVGEDEMDGGDVEGQPVVASSMYYDLADLPINDWKRRRLRWMPIVPAHIRHNFDGGVAVHVRGTVTGGPVLAQARQGSWNLGEEVAFEEGPIHAVFLIPTKKGRGFTNLHFALKENKGVLRIDASTIVPYGKAVRNARLALPEGTRVFDLFASPEFFAP
ncbi:MAG: hypothetical protein ACOX5G_03750 [Kiritimatiellia bacterium]